MSRPFVRSALLLAAIASVASAQTKRVLTAADYDRAVKMLNVSQALVVGGTVQPNWLADDRFWYRTATLTDTSFVIVDPVKKARTPLFTAALATTLSKAAADTSLTLKRLNGLAANLVTVSPKGDSIHFDLSGTNWVCDSRGGKCVRGVAPVAELVLPGGRGRGGDPAAGRGGRGGGGGRGAGGPTVTITKTCGPDVTGVTNTGGGGRGGRGGGAGGGAQQGPPANSSPDGTKAIFICDWNLWVHDVASGQDRQLTTDGVKDFGYATSNAGWVTTAAATLSWSPDGKKIATQQQDERHVGDMFLVQSPVNGGHPVLREWKYPLVGDSVVAMIHRVIIDVETGKITRLSMPPDFHRAMSGDNISMAELQWSPDGTKLAFVSTSRDHKTSVAKVADVATGAVRTVMQETVATQFDPQVLWKVLWASNEIIWNSERDDWSQLYLYDLNTGQLKNQITTGEGVVESVTKIDEKTRTIWYTANGKEPGQDPYLAHYYKVGFDGKGQTSLTPALGGHSVQLSPDNKYLVDTYSQTDVPPVVELRDGTTGALILPLEKADISKLLASGWKPPMQIKMKSADGKWDIYGQLFRPTNFDPTKKYPIINNAYPGPQSGSVGGRTFTTSHGDKQALAELGFIVVSIDGTGTPDRSRSFHDNYYAAMGRHNTLPDQVAGMKELARNYPWIDIDKAAMWGHSGGGFITADAMLRAPFNDFFKVGISESGNHDQRQYEDDWGERYQGLLVKNANGSGDNYDIEATASQAAGLKGHLFLIHGTMDNNVPPYNTLNLVDALVKANKNFDLLMMVNSPHGYQQGPYVMHRRWDYFVRYLLDAEPPADYLLPGQAGGTGGGRGRGGPNFQR